MALADTPEVKPAKPVKIKLTENEIEPKQFFLNFLKGFVGLVVTVLGVTSVKRLMGHYYYNTSDSSFESVREFYAAVDSDFAIGIVVMTLWSIGLFLSGYLASRKLVDANTMVLALTVVVVAFWVVPSLYVQGGVLGITTALRMLTIFPMIIWGASFAQKRSNTSSTSTIV